MSNAPFPAVSTIRDISPSVPLALSNWAARKPLGISIVGGLIVSQMLTLFTTPVIYLYLDRFQWRLRSRREARKAAKQPKETVPVVQDHAPSW